MFNSSIQPSLNLLKTLPDLLAQICVYINYIWRKYLLQTIFNIQVSSEVFDRPDIGTYIKFIISELWTPNLRHLTRPLHASSVTHVWFTLIFRACVLKSWFNATILSLVNTELWTPYQNIDIILIMQRSPVSLTIFNRLCIQHVPGCDGQILVASLAMI